MIKIHILTTCDHCQGQGYLPIGEAVSHTGEKYIRHVPCPQCEGSGQSPKWISLEELAALIEEAKYSHEQMLITECASTVNLG